MWMPSGAANTPEFGSVSFAFGINDRGQVAGEYYDANAVPHSYVATPAPGNSAAAASGSAGGVADHASLVAASFLLDKRDRLHGDPFALGVD